MLAIFDANGVAFIVGAVVVGALQIISMLNNNREKRDRIKREQELEDRIYKKEQETQSVLRKVANGVESVHQATNGLHAVIVNAAEKESFRLGKAEEKAEEKERVEDAKLDS